MMIEEALFAHLTGHAGLSALVADRVYPLIIPQGKPPQGKPLPAVTYQRVTGPRVQSHTGPTGLAHPTYQLSCRADTHLEAKRVAAEIRNALVNFSGEMGGSGGVPVQGIRLSDDIDLYEQEPPPCFRVDVDVVIWHEE